MESRSPYNNKEPEERPRNQQKKPPRFRLIRLEDRIAPANGSWSLKPTKCANSEKVCWGW